MIKVEYNTMAESRIFTFPPKSTIFREREETNEMYFIISGKVKIIKSTGDGKNLILAELGPGAMIGEMSLISGRPRSATALTINEVKVKVITKDIFQKSAAGIPAWAMCITKVLIERLRQTNIMLKKHANIEVFQDVNDDDIEFNHRFTIDYKEEKYPCLLFLKGYFFSNDTLVIENFLNNLMRKKMQKISLDFSGVIDIDSAAIEYLIDLVKRLKRGKIDITLHNVQLIHTKVSTNTALKEVISTLSPPRKNVPAGTYLIKQGEKSDTMYIVKSGRFEIVRTIDKREVSFAEIGAGDVIGEMTLIAGGKRSASVKAMKPGIVFEITHADIYNNKFNIPHWFLRIIQQLIARIRDSDEILDRIVKKEETTIEHIGIEIDYLPDKSMAGIFKLNGELIQANRNSFKNQIIRLIGSGFLTIILDFSNIDYMDKSYIPLLNQLSEHLASKNGKLHFINTNTAISTILRGSITSNRENSVHTPPVKHNKTTIVKDSIDPVTGLHSREYFQKVVEEEIERCKRYKSILSVLSIGIDRLSAGNTVKVSSSFVQKEVAGLIKNRFRKVDISARTADRLFQVLLPGTDIKNAKNVAEQFCKTVRETKFRFKNNDIHITCSCGITFHNEGDDTDTLLARSRNALNEAKSQGKSRIVVLKG